MTQNKALQEVQERTDKVALWADRLKNLSERKDNPITMAQFCRKYGFNFPHLSRAKDMNPLPFNRFIKKVEKALEEQGV